MSDITLKVTKEDYNNLLLSKYDRNRYWSEMDRRVCNEYERVNNIRQEVIDE